MLGFEVIKFQLQLIVNIIVVVIIVMLEIEKCLQVHWWLNEKLK